MKGESLRLSYRQKKHFRLEYVCLLAPLQVFQGLPLFHFPFGFSELLTFVLHLGIKVPGDARGTRQSLTSSLLS